MRAITLVLIGFALIAAVNCYAFTATGTVQVGSNSAWPATIKADTSSTVQKLQIAYSFGVTELELYNQQSRYQICPSSCKNYFLTNPMPDFGYRSGGTADSNNQMRYSYTSNGYTTTLWTDRSTGNLVKVVQTGTGYSRTYTFSSITAGTQTFATPPSNCASVQCGQALDLMLVIDSSGSISPSDYVIEMDYAQQVIDSFTIGTYGVHAGLVTFATGALLRQSITSDKTLLTNAINSAQQQGGETNIGDAILLASQQFSSLGRGGGVPKVIILLTDGKANRPDPTPISYMIQQANAAKASGILIYAIGVGSLVQQTDLNDIASAPTSQYTSLVGNFADLQNTINAILQQVCVGGEVDGCNPSCYSDTQFCGCGQCLCVGSDAVSCGDRGTFVGGNVCSCTCENGWTQTTGGTQTHSCMRCPVTSCQNGGTIVNDPVNGICGCNCRTNYDGANCETCTFSCTAPAQVDNCAAGTCKCAAGTFLTLASGCRTCDQNACGDHGTPNGACNGCICDTNWSGNRCQDCNWVCTHGTKNADCQSCTCNTPWDGPNCNNCAIVCLNGGVKNTQNGQCKCDCPPKYTGSTCNSCDSDYCVHGRSNNNYPTCSCTCDANWGGADCNTCTIQCARGVTHNTNGECYCECPAGYTGTLCDQCDANYCVHGTQGALPNRCHLCTCDTNWGGNRCDDCLLNNAGNTPQCGTNSSPNPECDACICPRSGSGIVLTEGTYCDSCSSTLCVNGVINPATFPDCRCTCPSNFQGRRCDRCVSNLCSNGGTPTSQTTCNSCNCDPTKNWSGTFCTECDLVCVHGTRNTAVCQCECDDYWIGNNCDDCHNTDPSVCYECSYNGVLNEDCTACICDEFHTGEICDECKFDCGPHGQRSADCRTCECFDGWIGDDCMVCDTSVNSIYCNGKGTIVNSDTDCNVCVCRNQWDGDDCSECPIDCNDNGRHNNDCTGCVCDNSWNTSDNCLTCGLDCNNNGVPNEDCTACICDDGYTGTLCNYCEPSYINRCVYDSGVLTDDCACDCVDQWTGQYCNECDLTVLNCVNGDIIDYSINGEPQCRCRCRDNWVGEECDYCGFLLADNSLYQCPDDLSEPVITDCSCHCPEYYRDIEGCDECIITLEDCVHVKPNTVPDLTRGVCACICDGNWSGRNCSICDPELVICQRGWRLNTDNCECEEICGDGIIVGDEQCEVSLMESVDTVCCQDCFFDERRPCDDLRSCTRFDFCEVNSTSSTISCYGTDEVDYTVDADRRSIPLGPLTSNYWTKWGITVTSSVPVSIVDTRTLGYPSTNPCGGDIVFDRVIVAPGGQSNANLCFNFDEPTEVQSISVINNAKEPGATNSFIINFFCTTTIFPIQVYARNYGPGSVEFIRNPCSGFLVTKICYNNFPTGAIGPLFFCDDNNYNLGRLGDYVWYDISVDNIQDSNELPVPNVPVKLFEGTFNRYLGLTYTNDQGLYIFEYLYNGNYSVEFNIPNGYTFSTPVRYPYGFEVPHFGSLDNNYITDTVKEILTVDVGIYLFGAIGDYVFYDVSEDGIQDEPASYAVPGVTMKLYEAGNLNNVLRTQETDAFGNYLFAPLPVYKTATTFYDYIVVMTPPAGSTVTYRFSGNDRAIDSNFDRVTYVSDVVSLTPQKVYDLTVDAGIYYCCGSVGDRVWYDDKTINGIQDGNEEGVPNVRVTLYHNYAAIGSQLTNATGYYLFTGLQLSGSYYVNFDRVTGWVLTEKSKGSDRGLDSDANPNGDTDVFYLTRQRPDRRDIDAGIKRGCVSATECTTNDLCQTAVCANNECVFTPSVTCAPLTDPCVEPVCQPSTGDCVPVPIISTVVIPCDDKNECTNVDICVGGQCKGTPSNGGTCDDGSICTTTDTCVAGVCTGTPCTENPDPCFTTICDVTGCRDVPSPNTPCNDNNFCTENDVCGSTGVCAGTPKVCQNNEYCKTYTCDPRNGECKPTITPDVPCSDGSPCTENDTCDSRGRCNGTPITCTGTNPCLNYFCQGGVCKTSVKSSTTPCNDNNDCTANDRCQPDATCAGTPLNCNDGKTCTTDTCEAGTCVHRVNPGAACTDNNSCTTDACDNLTGNCISTPIDCDDRNECTRDQCEAGQCAHYPLTTSCNDRDLCTVFDACDITGTCKGVAKNCDDGNECTDDRCNPITGACEHIDNSNPCNDGTECSGTSYCTAGQCVGYDIVQCVSTNPCTIAYCDGVTGSCIEESKVDNTVCQTDDLCRLNGVCLQGECQGRETVCNDNNPCTIDSCLNGICVFTHSAATNNVPCNDGNACTETDVCIYDAGFNLSRCRGVEKQCDDGNVCTDDFCNILTGECDVENFDSTVSCDDGVACTLNDVCVEGECHGTERVCTPSGICRSNVCNEATGLCEESITTAATCDDGQDCTVRDTCDALGNCRGVNKCDELVHPNPCKDYQCSDTGDCIIVNVAENTPCNDGNACTQTDVCILGRCTGTNPFPCTSDTCNRRECVDNAGTPTCRTTFTSDTCGTSTECHDFICSSGTCTTVTSKDCNAGNTNPCTRRVCGADGTCIEENITGPCEDGDACTDNICSNGRCIETNRQVPCGDIQCTPEVPCPAAENCFHYDCINNQCILSADTCTASSNPCIRVECDRTTGQCTPTKLENSRCNDNNGCTSGDLCVSTGTGALDIECRGVDIPCSTQRCKQGVCNPLTGQCSYTITEGETCNDGVACTEDDVCDAEANCRGTPISCDDGNTCTNDACVNGECVHENNSNICSDGNACTTNDRCVEGTCTSQTATTCAESTDPCLRTVCDPIRGCVSVAVEDGVVCGENDDGCLNGDSVCRGGVCIPPEGITCQDPIDPQCPFVCVNNECQVTNSFCDDRDPCTVQDRCRANGECIGVRLDCSDLDTGCVEGVCVNGACVERPVAGATDCDDGDLCTNNYCENGQCKSTAVTCTSNNPCERFTCDPARGCVASNNPVSCTPTGIFNRCFDYICVDRACTQVPPALTCDDSNPCTEDLCAPETGECVHRNNDLLQCSDNNPCTTDTCVAGRCVSSQINCDDGNVCTTDTCVGGVCVRSDNSNVCELSTGCITSGICSNRNCVPATFSTCSSDNLQQCQEVFCDKVTGDCRVNTITDGTTSCTDGDDCTENDVCTPNGCRGTPVVCPTSTVECNESFCEAGECKLRANNDLECSSADTTCNTSICIDGQCVVDETAFIDCSDNNTCTYNNRCTENGCEATEYSCILSPCIYSSCTDDGFCSFDNAVSSWNPLTYIAFRTQVANETTPRYYVVAVSSLTGDIRGFVRVSKSVVSLVVKPYVGELYALVNNDTVLQLYRIPVNASAVNVLADGTFSGWNYITRIPTTIQQPDLTFKPNFVAVNQPYSYTFNARSKSTGKFYTLNTATDPAGQTVNLTETVSGWQGATWDNHGRYIFGVEDGYLKAFDVSADNGGIKDACTGPIISDVTDASFIDMVTRYDETIVGATQNSTNINIFSVRFDKDVNGNDICNTIVSSLNKTRFFTPSGGAEVFISITAIAFDDTICTTAIGNPTSNGGNVTNHGGGGTPNNGGGGSPPPPVNPPPPDQVTHIQGGSSPGAHSPGTTDNGVLTGGTGSIATAVVSVVGTSAVAAFAIFAVVLGLNNTKKDPPANLTAALVSTETSAIASDNPLFQGANEAGNNILA